jgi:hypothetical protein
LPHQQFVLQKVATGEHAFVDLAGRYTKTTLDEQIAARDRRLAKQRRQDRRQAREAAAAAEPPSSMVDDAKTAVRAAMRRLRTR